MREEDRGKMLRRPRYALAVYAALLVLLLFLAPRLTPHLVVMLGLVLTLLGLISVYGPALVKEPVKISL